MTSENQLNNDHLVEFTNQLTLKDLQFILLVWKDRISIWNPNTRRQDTVDDIWINGTAVEIGIPQEETISPERPGPAEHDCRGY